MIGWTFPEIVNAEFNCRHVTDEVCEFVEAVEHYDGGSNRLALIEEGLDVIHAVETVLRKAGVTYEELANGVNYVTNKNRLRGYYAVDDRPTTRKNQVQ